MDEEVKRYSDSNVKGLQRSGLDRMTFRGSNMLGFFMPMPATVHSHAPVVHVCLV
jgi:hypothetical protein